MYVKEITEQAILTFKPDQNLLLAFASMEASNVKSAPVVGDKQKCFGILINSFNELIISKKKIDHHKKINDISLATFPTLYEDILITNIPYFPQPFLPVLDSFEKYKGVLNASKLWMTLQSFCAGNLDDMILDNVSDGVILSTGGVIRYVNNKASSFIGLKRQNIVGGKLNMFISNFELNKLENYKTVDVIIQDISKKVKMVPCLFKGLQSSVIIIHDDFIVKELQRGLIGNLSMDNDHSELFKTYYDGLSIMDVEGTIVQINPAHENILGIKNKDISGKTVFDLVKKGIINTAVTPKVVISKHIITVKQKTLTRSNIFTTGVPIYDTNNNMQGVLAISRDFSKIKSAAIKGNNHTKKDRIFSKKDIHILDTIRKQGYIFNSPNMMRIISDVVSNIAPADVNVLITGETGTGKEIIAEIIHQFGVRNNKPFFKINCGAIPKNLVESELFGYVGGSFTGALKSGKPGLFEQAHGGTLLLDEIAELPMDSQVKLLRVIQDYEIKRVGSVKSKKVDVRLIASTNRDLLVMVEKEAFREDLFHRLNVIPIKLPPLRERYQDIPYLVNHYLNKSRIKFGKKTVFSPEAIAILTSYKWPGNVRELVNIVERCVLMARGSSIKPMDLPKVLLNNYDESGDAILLLKEAKEKIECEFILKAINRVGSTHKAAKMLGISQSTVFRKLKKIRRLADSNQNGSIRNF